MAGELCRHIKPISIDHMPKIQRRLGDVSHLYKDLALAIENNEELDLSDGTWYNEIFNLLKETEMELKE